MTPPPQNQQQQYQNYQNSPATVYQHQQPPPQQQQYQTSSPPPSPVAQQTTQSSAEVAETLDAAARRMGAFQAKIQHLVKQHSSLAQECSELRAKVEAAEKKRDRAKLEIDKVLNASRQELVQLQLLTGRSV
jgi:hypothetical protein